MSSVNKVILVGNLGNDPEVKYSASGSAVANFSMATTDKYQDKKTNDWIEKTEWHRVVFFGKRAEVVKKYLRKGSQIFVEGSLQTDKWTDKNGVERYTTKVIGSNFQMLGSKSEKTDANSGYNSNGSSNYVQPKPTPLPDEDFDDDVPF